MPKLGDMVPVASVPAINAGLSSARQPTMIGALGSPQMPLTTKDQPERASAKVKALIDTRVFGHVKATCIRPALDSLGGVLAAMAADHPDLAAALRANGTLVVRLRRPTSGKPSKLISNHAWGTAIDFMLAGEDSIGATGEVIPYYIALLIPYFNAAGWYAGVGFKDDMHFEVAEETIQAWDAAGKFGAA